MYVSILVFMSVYYDVLVYYCIFLVVWWCIFLTLDSVPVCYGCVFIHYSIEALAVNEVDGLYFLIR